MTLDQIVGNLKSLANPDNVAGMARYGISTEGCLGVPMPVLRKMAGEIREMDARSARWIAADALRELTDGKSWYRWRNTGRKWKGVVL